VLFRLFLCIPCMGIRLELTFTNFVMQEKLCKYSIYNLGMTKLGLPLAGPILVIERGKTAKTLKEKHGDIIIP
jgi:hypothetical protein